MQERRKREGYSDRERQTDRQTDTDTERRRSKMRKEKAMATTTASKSKLHDDWPITCFQNMIFATLVTPALDVCLPVFTYL